MYSAYVCTYTVDPSILDTLGPEGTVLIIEMSSFQGLKMYYDKAWRIIWFQWCVCGHNRGVSAIPGSGLVGFQYSGTSDSGLSQMRTQYDKPLYKGHNLWFQYNSYNTLSKRKTSLQRTKQLNLCMLSPKCPLFRGSTVCIGYILSRCAAAHWTGYN